MLKLHPSTFHGESIGAICAATYKHTKNKSEYLEYIENNTDLEVLSIAAACWEAIDQYLGNHHEQ